MALKHWSSTLLKNLSDFEVHVESLAVDMAPLHTLSSRLLQRVDSDFFQQSHEMCDAESNLVRSCKRLQSSLLKCPSYRAIHNGVALLSIVCSKTEWRFAFLEDIEPRGGDLEQLLDDISSYVQDTFYDIAVSMFSY